MAKIFERDVDFNSDLQPGDRIELLFERAIRDGQFAGYGEIKAAIMDNDGRHLTAIGSKDAAGNAEWHDAEGQSLKRQFLKSPLFFDPRVTSRFSNRRFHPVHGTYRAHLGVDFGAPYGTPVHTVANGAVEFAGSFRRGRPDGPRPPRGRVPDRVSPLVLVCVGRARRCARVPGPGHRLRGRDAARPQARTWTTGS